jgi:hypothetical protein
MRQNASSKGYFRKILSKPLPNPPTHAIIIHTLPKGAANMVCKAAFCAIIPMLWLGRDYYDPGLLPHPSFS